MNNPAKVVCLGGGHGLSATLSAMRQITSEITAIVTVADNGGSSGRLRAEFNSLPPGDLRMALAALCADDQWGRDWAQIMQYRFSSDGQMNGHAIGNLLLAALWDRDHDPVKGIQRVASLLKIVGNVLPMSLQPLDIEAKFQDRSGVKQIRGQVEVAAATGKMTSLKLIPENPIATPEALSAIKNADLITIGPGSWLSSVMPHFLLSEQAKTIVDSQARKVMILNLPDHKYGDEYSRYTPREHIELVLKYAPKLKIDFAIVDKSKFSNANQDYTELERLITDQGGQLIDEKLASKSSEFHHDVDKLAQVFKQVLNSVKVSN
jgi:uncharacterized cofD-like protein